MMKSDGVFTNIMTNTRYIIRKGESEVIIMKLLVVIDMQNDFIDGALGTKEAVRILDNVQKKLEDYRKQGYPVIFTRDTHKEGYLETLEGKKLPVVHCICNTAGWELHSRLEVSGAKIIDKPTFGSVELADYIGENYIERDCPDLEIELVGLCTDICVISNALVLKAFYPENEITADASCCAGVTPQSHRNALEAMKMCHINIING